MDKMAWPGWKTLRLIGRGSFGAVYEIQREILGCLEKAALKVITIPQNPGDVEDMIGEGYDDRSITDTFHSYLKSIVSEYSLMRKLNGSTNVVNCDDIRYVQHDDGIGWDIYIKMELLTPLAKALPQTITEETVIKLGRDISTALELCGRYDIIHRDIKPQNIFVSERGDFKLGDFGIAKTAEKTSGGTKIGTYKYMAPEVYNNRPYGSAVDIYSLGLVMYWMLNGRRLPFMPLPPQKLTPQLEEQARVRRLSGEPLPPPAYGSEALKGIVLKACAFDPKDRYASAGQMKQALDALVGAAGESVVLLLPERSEGPAPESAEEGTALMAEEPEGTALMAEEPEGTALMAEEPEGTALMAEEPEKAPETPAAEEPPPAEPPRKTRKHDEAFAPPAADALMQPPKADALLDAPPEPTPPKRKWGRWQN